MKKVMRTFVIPVFIGIMVTMFNLSLSAQSPPAPPEDAGSGGGPVGGGAPIGCGLVVLMALSAAYAGKKVFSGKFNAQE